MSVKTNKDDIDKLILMSKQFKSFFAVGLPEEKEKGIIVVQKLGKPEEFIAMLASAIYTDKDLVSVFLIAISEAAKLKQQDNYETDIQKA